MPDPAPLDRGVTGGTVRAVRESGELEVALTADPETLVLCDVLETGPLRGATFGPGDRVVLMMPEGSDEMGCVLGKRRTLTPEEVRGEETVLEVEHPVRIRAGKARVDLSPDGRIGIQGRDVVSRATRRNRIKGGSVLIN